MKPLKVRMETELAGLPFVCEGFHLNALKGGALNSSYRLATSNKSYFVKTFESDNIAVLDRKRLFDIQQTLAEKGLAVKPIYLSKTETFQVDQWLDVATLDMAGLSDVETSQTLASVLSTLHSTEVDAPELDLPSQWQHYINLIDLPVSAQQQRTLDNYRDVWQQACANKTVFCHNDLALSHVTYATPYKVFDWEYCSKSCPYFDLASCILVNGFSATNEASLCAFYAQSTKQRVSEVVAKVTTMKPLVELTNMLWYQAAKQSA